MARSISLNFPHDLGAARARQLVAERLDALRAQFGDKIGSSQITWAGNDARVDVSALAQKATGTINVTDRDVRIQISLPLLLSPLSGKIGGFLSGFAEDTLRSTRR